MKKIPGFPRIRQRVLAVAIAQVFVVASADVNATIIQVGSQVSGGNACSLIDAIVAADLNQTTGNCPGGNDADGGGDVLSLTAGAVYSLTQGYGTGLDDGPTGLPSISSKIVVAGHGATIERAAGAPPFRLMEVTGTGDLSLDRATLRNGSALYVETAPDPYELFGGGAILNAGRLTISNSTLTGNVAGIGGAVASLGELSIVSSHLSDNSAVAGGAVLGQYSTEIVRSTISGNKVWVAGGGIVSKYGLSVRESTISGNGAAPTIALPLPGAPVAADTAKYGGGIMAIGDVTVTSSTVSGNSAFVGAGVVGGATYYNGRSAGSLTIDNSTISGNVAQGYIGSTTTSGKSAPESFAGGVFSAGGALTLRNTTVAENQGGGLLRFDSLGVLGAATAATDAGSRPIDELRKHVAPFYLESVRTRGKSAKAVPPPTGSAVVANVVMAGNTLGDCATGVPFTAFTHNLVQDGSCGTTATPALLAPLADNGGRTLTHALLAGSPAIDGGDPATCTAVGPTDQRGFARSSDGNSDGTVVCDIGAYEHRSTAAIPALSFVAQGILALLVSTAGMLGFRRRSGRG